MPQTQSIRQPSELRPNEVRLDERQMPVPSWEEELRRGLRSADDLLRAGWIAAEEVPAYEKILARYKFLLTPYYASLINRSDPSCPIRRQAIPSGDELEDYAGFHSDPLSDLSHQPESRITHRYDRRLLIHLTPNCSMYCRFCFRKSLLNELSSDLFGGRLDSALAYLREHTEVEEVIFSGGDPFLVRDEALRGVLRGLADIGHLRRFRFHTRVPVTLPARVTSGLADVLKEAGRPTVVVCHFNHPRELTPQSAEAVARLKHAGVTVLNQSVLLKDVNDSAPALCELSRKLFDFGVVPYYLHHPDRSRGTRHFDVSVEKGLAIHEAMAKDLPGYLVPRYVIDVVGKPYKMTVKEYVVSLIQAGNSI